MLIDNASRQPWPDLLKFIAGAANAPDAAYREVAFKLLSAMSDTVGKFLKVRPFQTTVSLIGAFM